MLLSAENISFAYDSKPVLVAQDFEIKSGEVVGLLAPSGRGKSTLAKILAGYLAPKSGRVLLDGKPLYGKKGVLARGEFNPVQLMFQHPEKAVNPRWKMRQILNETWNPPAELIEAMGIKESWMDRWPSELSGGELQRFCLLRALAPQTKFLIADEMSSMLDMVTQVQMWNLVLGQMKSRELGLLVIAHDAALIERLCDRVMELPELEHTGDSNIKK